MTKDYIKVPVESVEYQFAIEQGLREENQKLKSAINDVLDVLVDGGAPNLIWIKNRLLEAVEDQSNQIER